MNKPKIFISYAHSDEEYKVNIEKQLSTLKRNNEIELWNDRMINAGKEWDKEIKKELLEADIILLLISADFLASDYCNDIEVRIALEKHELKQAIIIPIIIRACDWNAAPFGKIQALPKNAKPIKNWPDVDEAYLDVIRGIRNILFHKTQIEISSTHILHEFPTYPMVDAVDVPKNIIDNISKTIPINEAETWINEANRFRKKADPDDPKTTIIELHTLQSVYQLSSSDYWAKVIGQARLHGPRMLAALLLTVPDSGFTTSAKEDKDELLQRLKQYNL
ncbi:TIR domain-containing protein [Spirosoma sp. HMF4905]|uniref:TIR domain-containing protein n=1 Tax=Spirosoma arboris TaxID=2682092 RepID=A0A7K1SJL1_9BACT|nr:toll/interleukin-1 receptor domain-containing protein [Spirosoma arboris]MVM33997.1 TIR domain-containing protein [Spirosoma arboris]